MQTPVEVMVGQDNIICAVNTAWNHFAVENACEDLLAEHVVGQSLLDYVEGGATRIYVETMLHMVRQGDQLLSCPYRCDSPDMRREMEVRLFPPINGVVKMQHRLVSERPLYHHTTFQTVAENRHACAEQIKRCSHCNNLRVHWKWYDVEEIEKAGLRHLAEPIQVYYGICDRCCGTLDQKVVIQQQSMVM
ncbi:hypothetical protein [Magnetococcus sp. PR-3]|uniref:hypothetical protein n=1 Tax=Magnetococcus sp. PR-3 TaxID=3120355 RepID=UPI002FCDE4A3